MSFFISAFLFITDYLAEMYDPHPETPGPWFASHFHRFLDDGSGDGGENNEPTIFAKGWAWLKDHFTPEPFVRNKNNVD